MLFAGLPDDITFRGLHEEPAKQSYLVVFESDEFDPVPEGKQIPVRRLVGASVDFDDPLTTSNGGRASSADENT